MDPVSVFRTLWSHWKLAIPLALIVVAACLFVFFNGPRSYDSSATYVLVRPGDNPTMSEGTPDAGNPFLRTGDASLATQVVVARMGAPDIAEKLKNDGLSDNFTVRIASELNSGQILKVDSSASTPELTIATTKKLGDLLLENLRSVQIDGGANDQFLLTAQAITLPTEAAERFSSRLRSVIMVGIAGIVLLFGVVSIAQAVDRRKSDRSTLEGKQVVDLENVP